MLKRSLCDRSCHPDLYQEQLGSGKNIENIPRSSQSPILPILTIPNPPWKEFAGQILYGFRLFMHTMEDEKDEERWQDGRKYNWKQVLGRQFKRNVAGMPTVFSPLSQMSWNFCSAVAWVKVLLYGHSRLFIRCRNQYTIAQCVHCTVGFPCSKKSPVVATGE